MKYKIPKTFMGRPVKGAMERALAKQKTKPESPETKPEFMPDINLEGYIKLPQHNLYIAKSKSLHNLTWQNTWNELEKQNLKMPTIRQFMDFLELLRQGIQGNPVYDAQGKQVSEQEIQQIYNEITEKRNPWRSEWLDAYFEKQGNELYILTQNKSKREKLESCLMKDKAPGIDLEHWLKNATKQGLPPSNNPKGSLYYWYPKDGLVAGFSANSDRAGLDCDGNPGDSDSVLGVRAAAQKI